MWSRVYRNHFIMAFPSFDTATNAWAPQLERRAISQVGVCQIPKTLHDRERSGNLCAKEGPNVD